MYAIKGPLDIYNDIEVRPPHGVKGPNISMKNTNELKNAMKEYNNLIMIESNDIDKKLFSKLS